MQSVLLSINVHGTELDPRISSNASNCSLLDVIRNRFCESNPDCFLSPESLSGPTGISGITNGSGEHGYHQTFFEIKELIKNQIIKVGDHSTLTDIVLSSHSRGGLCFLSVCYWLKRKYPGVMVSVLTSDLTSGPGGSFESYQLPDNVRRWWNIVPSHRPVLFHKQRLPRGVVHIGIVGEHNTAVCPISIEHAKFLCAIYSWFMRYASDHISFKLPHKFITPSALLSKDDPDGMSFEISITERDLSEVAIKQSYQHIQNPIKNHPDFNSQVKLSFITSYPDILTSLMLKHTPFILGYELNPNLQQLNYLERFKIYDFDLFMARLKAYLASDPKHRSLANCIIQLPIFLTFNFPHLKPELVYAIVMNYASSHYSLLSIQNELADIIPAPSGLIYTHAPDLAPSLSRYITETVNKLADDLSVSLQPQPINISGHTYYWADHLNTMVPDDNQRHHTHHLNEYIAPRKLILLLGVLIFMAITLALAIRTAKAIRRIALNCLTRARSAFKLSRRIANVYHPDHSSTVLNSLAAPRSVNKPETTTKHVPQHSAVSSGSNRGPLSCTML
ncbi:MAG: hypothetical protein VXY77_04150 [Pseudomonadota bacterium]|nr:hypothetical protein [Pseudomonadota bacterium]